ncbi:DUF1996 domain-containing protein [Nonomuraea sp. NPDC046802]|uniref:DUF1996 domain-containing protein n=1 Tax=Nonomuraea sp. NPDC046802 TaxID=3154919 RepID=UPI0033DD114A
MSLGGSVALALSGSPLSAQAGTVTLDFRSAEEQTIVCPGVADQLPEIPAAAQAEVERNLAQLDTQLQEANNRLAISSDQGGSNFIQNAILGPLADKREATLNRIATAIGRTADRPTGLNSLATCTLSDSEQPPVIASPAPGNGTASPAPDPGNGTRSSAPDPGDSIGPPPEPDVGAGGSQTIVCPGVADQLPEIPAAAQAEVERNLAQLDTQLQEANNRLAISSDQGGSNFIQNAILGPLADKREATLNRIATAIGRTADRPTGLNSLATCTLGDSGARATAAGPTADDFIDIRQVPAVKRPRAGDDASTGTFISQCGTTHENRDNAITAPGVPEGAQAQYDYVGNMSTDALSTNESLAEANTSCRNRADRSTYFWPTLRVRDSNIDAPSTAATDSPAKADGTTGTNTPAAKATNTAKADDNNAKADNNAKESATPTASSTAKKSATPTASSTAKKSATPTASSTAKADSHDSYGATDPYGATGTDSTASADPSANPSASASADASTSAYATNGADGADGAKGSNGTTGEANNNNIGKPVQPSSVRLEYRGNPTSQITAAPQFLRLLSGDARAVTNGPADARPTWTCTGFTDRLTDKYPICPSGSRLVRVFDMPSCWDGQNVDSTDHRTHLTFPDESGACPSGTQAVPQLRLTLTYDNVPNTTPNGTEVPFAVDSFSSQQNSPNTDHAGSIVVMSKQLMNKVVRCLNNGREC